MFEATRGASVRSDIAIDDVVFERGPCRGIHDKLIIIHICYSRYHEQLYILFVLLSTQNMLMTISLICASLEIIMIFSQLILNRKDRKRKMLGNLKPCMWPYSWSAVICEDESKGDDWIVSRNHHLKTFLVYLTFEHLVHSWYTVSHVCITCTHILNTWLKIETILGHLRKPLYRCLIDFICTSESGYQHVELVIFFMSNKTENCRDFYFMRIAFFLFTLNL